jgi:hypothetical protein
LAEGETKLTGPDLAKGIPLESLPDGQMLVGHAKAIGLQIFNFTETRA